MVAHSVRRRDVRLGGVPPPYLATLAEVNRVLKGRPCDRLEVACLLSQFVMAVIAAHWRHHVAKLTGTDAALPARCAVPGWMRWAHSTRDGLAHAFPIEDSQQGRWLRAVCSSTVPPAALDFATVFGPRCVRACPPDLWARDQPSCSRTRQ